MASAADYGWLANYDYRQTRLAGEGCVTVVRGLDVPGVVRALGGNPSVTPEPVEEFLVEHDFFPPAAAAVGWVADVVVAVEVRGSAGSRPEVLRPASGGGLAVSVYWNQDTGHSTFSYARAGEVVTTFDPLFPEDRSGADPDHLLAEMADLGFGLDGGPNLPASFVLAERVTGVALSRDDVHGVRDVWRLGSILADDRPSLPVEGHGLHFRDADLAARVAAAGADRQRQVAALVAQRVAAAAGFDRAPGIREAIEGLTNRPARPLTATAAETVRRTIDEGGTTAHVARILHAATNPDPLAAALDTLLYAAIPVPDDRLFADVRRLLADGAVNRRRR